MEDQKILKGPIEKDGKRYLAGYTPSSDILGIYIFKGQDVDSIIELGFGFDGSKVSVILIALPNIDIEPLKFDLGLYSPDNMDDILDYSKISTELLKCNLDIPEDVYYLLSSEMSKVLPDIFNKIKF